MKVIYYFVISLLIDIVFLLGGDLEYKDNDDDYTEGFIEYNSEEREDCSKVTSLKPYCKKVIRSEYPFPLKHPFKSDQNYISFLDFTINKKINHIIAETIDMDTENKENMISLSLLCGKLSNAPCLDHSLYNECRTSKQNKINEIIKKIKYAYSNTFILGDEDLKFEYINMLFFISQNFDSITYGDITEFIRIIQDITKIFSSMKTHFANDNYQLILSIVNGILNNMIDMLHYFEIDYKDKDTVITNTRMIINQNRFDVKEIIETILPYSKALTDPVQFHNFILKFHQLSTIDSSSEKAQLSLGDSDSSTFDFTLKTFKDMTIDYIMTIVYSSFPLLSFNNTMINSKVITVIPFKSDNTIINTENFSPEAEIVFGNLKENDDMKYCAYVIIKNGNVDINNSGMKSIKRAKKTICKTTRFTNYIITKYKVNNNSNLIWWILLLVSVFVVALIGLGIYYFISMKDSRENSKKDLEDLDESNLQLPLQTREPSIEDKPNNNNP